MNVGLVFGIIFAAILIGFVLFFGFNYINEMFDINCKATVGDQIIKIREITDKTFRLSLGAKQEYVLLIPPCVEKICFVDHEDPFSYGNWETNSVLTRLITENEYSVIIFEKDETFEGYVVDHLKPDYNFCVSSKKTLLLTNDGPFVMVKPRLIGV